MKKKNPGRITYVLSVNPVGSFVIKNQITGAEKIFPRERFETNLYTSASAMLMTFQVETPCTCMELLLDTTAVRAIDEIVSANRVLF